MRVFARKGFHASRVGDIAEEAGVAHGLLYHYFRSKDEVLEEVFRENWSVLLARIASVEATDEPAADQLRHIAAIVLRTGSICPTSCAWWFASSAGALKSPSGSACSRSRSTPSSE